MSARSITGVAADLVSLAGITGLRGRYEEPWRHYHSWAHPIAMLEHLGRAELDGVSIADREAAVGFVLWHDAIYDPEAPHGRNERLSAALCRMELAPLVSERTVERAIAAILATIDHRAPPAEASPDAPLLLDIDLSILGASEAGFAAYDAAIAREYAHVAPDAYRTGRAAVLRRFLERDRLFLTDWGHARWEARARGNLARAIDALAETPPEG